MGIPSSTSSFGDLRRGRSLKRCNEGGGELDISRSITMGGKQVKGIPISDGLGRACWFPLWLNKVFSARAGPGLCPDVLLCDRGFGKKFISEKARSDPDFRLWELFGRGTVQETCGSSREQLEEALPLLKIPRLTILRI